MLWKVNYELKLSTERFFIAVTFIIKNLSNQWEFVA